MRQGPTGVASQLRRAAAVIALCAIAAIGLRAGSAVASGGRSWAARAAGLALYDIFGIAFGVCLVASTLLFAVMLQLRRLRRKRDRGSGADPAIPWWARVILGSLVALVIGGPAVLLLHDLYLHRAGRRPGTLTPPALRFGRNAPLSHYGGGSWPVFTGMGLALAALVVAIIVIRSRRASLLPPGEPDEAGEEAALREALTAGAAALQDVADPRGAIIACYAAMEEHLARAGAEPDEADTPAEVLARAAASGLVRSTAAGELTGLFRQARYGGRAMTEAERAAAESALARLRADLAAAGRARPEPGGADGRQPAGQVPAGAGP